MSSSRRIESEIVPEGLGSEDARMSQIWSNALPLACGFSHAIATICTNCSFLYTNPALTHAVKTSEPFFTLLLQWAINGEKPTAKISFSIGLIIIGLLMLTYNQVEDYSGVYFAVFSNLALSVRNVCVSLLTNHSPLSAARVFRNMSGFATLVCLCVLSFQFFSRRRERHPFVMSSHSLIVSSALSFFVYNYCSTFILSLCSLELYAVLNLLRRVIAIGLSLVIYRSNVSGSVSIIGLFCTATGLIMYELCRVYTSQTRSARVR